MDTAYVTSKGQLVVPARLRRKYGITPGTKIFFIERGNEILFQPVTPDYIRSVRGILKSHTAVAEELLQDRAMDRKKKDARLEKLSAR